MGADFAPWPTLAWMLVAADRRLNGRRPMTFANVAAPDPRRQRTDYDADARASPINRL